MRIFRNAFEAGRWAPGAVVTIGKFDGMHRGHQKLIRAAVKRAHASKARCLVVTFDLSPEQFVRLYPYRPILSEARKMEMLGKMGVDAVVLIPFNENLACISPESFAHLILAEQLKAKAVFVGEDFCFGKDRAGSIATLKEFGPRMGFSVHSVALTRLAGEKITAERIRGMLDQGREKDAEKLLGWKLDDQA